jgi:cell fate (sporulation/competence/biofilm development) regulator YlbF (YheA/YmcA/DUF963 family)
MQYAKAHDLAREIRESEECQTYLRLKEAVFADDTNKTLLTEYKKMQTRLQMAAMAQSSGREEEMQRFSQLTALLFANQEVSAYLLAEMRLQQAMGDIFKILTDASGLEFHLPGLE